MKRHDVDRHPLQTEDQRPTRHRAHHEWEERGTIPPPFRLWGSFLFILLSLLAWGVLTGSA